MKLVGLAHEIARKFEALDHPEIESVEVAVDPAGSPTNHSLLNFKFASGATAHVMVHSVRGPGIPRHQPYKIPKEGF